MFTEANTPFCLPLITYNFEGYFQLALPIVQAFFIQLLSPSTLTSNLCLRWPSVQVIKITQLLNLSGGLNHGRVIEILL